MSRHHHHNLSQVCLHHQHEPNVNDTEDDHHISENRTNFDGELLGSQATPEIDFILFGILTTRAFQRVVNHSCGWSMSREIRNQSWYDFANMMDFLCNINLLACFPFPSGQLVETEIWLRQMHTD